MSPLPPYLFFSSFFPFVFFLPPQSRSPRPPYLRLDVRKPKWDVVDALRRAGERDELDLVLGRFSLELVRESRVRRPKQPNVRDLWEGEGEGRRKEEDEEAEVEEDEEVEVEKDEEEKD